LNVTSPAACPVPPSTVPVPPSLILMLMGLGLVGIYQFRHLLRLNLISGNLATGTARGGYGINIEHAVAKPTQIVRNVWMGHASWRGTPARGASADAWGPTSSN
jgi:hypothetical protein